MTEENKNYSTSKDYRDNNKQTRIAIVTGSSRGIGKAIAQEFATAGYNVVLNAREESELSSAAEDIKKAVGKKSSSLQSITYLAGDISDEKTCSSLINHAIKTFGKWMF